MLKFSRNALAGAGDQNATAASTPKTEVAQPQEAPTQSKPAPPSDDTLDKQNANRIVNLNPAKNTAGK